MERGQQVSLPHAVGHLLGSAVGLLYGNFFRKFGRRPLAWTMYALVLLISAGPIFDAEGATKWLLGVVWLFAYLVALPVMFWLADASVRRSTNR